MIVPSLNPDGREIAQERGCTSKIGQTNAHGRDLDTDFTGKQLPHGWVESLGYRVCL